MKWAYLVPRGVDSAEAGLERSSPEVDDDSSAAVDHQIEDAVIAG